MHKSHDTLNLKVSATIIGHVMTFVVVVKSEQTHLKRDLFEGSVDDGLSLEGRSRMLNLRSKSCGGPGDTPAGNRQDCRNRSRGNQDSFQDLRSHFGFKKIQ